MKLLGHDGERRVAHAVISDPEDHTVMDRSGAVRSIQAANVTMPEDQLLAIWSPLHLERLARTYWRFLSRCTLGLIRVDYREDDRAVVLLRRPFVLLRFHPPDYDFDAPGRGIVRWRIRDGILVSQPGRDRDGYLEIDVRRRPAGEDAPGEVTLHVEVEVANFYPAIASGIGRWFYVNTQSRIHVLVTYGFLRSLARLELEPSAVGRFADLEADDDGTPVVTPRPVTAWPAAAAAAALVALVLALTALWRRR